MRSVGKQLALVVGLGMVVAGCASNGDNGGDDGEPQDLTGTPIPRTEMPAVDEPEGFPAVYERGKCKLRYVAKKSGKKPRREEVEAFVDRFAEQFFSGNFANVDTDAVNAAVGDLNIATGAIQPLSKMAAESKSDFGVEVSYTIDVQPHSEPNRRDIAAKIIAKGTMAIEGGPHKGAKKVTFNVSLDQPTSQDKLDEFRNDHAGLVGEYLGRLALLEISKLEGSAAENTITLVFRGFDRDEKTDLRAGLREVEGIDANSIQEKSAKGAKKEFRFVVSANIGLGELRENIEEMLLENDFACEVRQPQPNTLLYMKR